jgi:hypothetical protein
MPRVKNAPDIAENYSDASGGDGRQPTEEAFQNRCDAS